MGNVQVHSHWLRNGKCIHVYLNGYKTPVPPLPHTVQNTDNCYRSIFYAKKPPPGGSVLEGTRLIRHDKLFKAPQDTSNNLRAWHNSDKHSRSLGGMTTRIHPVVRTRNSSAEKKTDCPVEIKLMFCWSWGPFNLMSISFRWVLVSDRLLSVGTSPFTTWQDNGFEVCKFSFYGSSCGDHIVLEMKWKFVTKVPRPLEGVLKDLFWFLVMSRDPGRRPFWTPCQGCLVLG